MSVPVLRPSGLTLAGVRLYVPEDVLALRMPGGSRAFRSYVRELINRANAVSEVAGLGNASGLHVAVGLRPGGRAKAWCDPVGGGMPDGALWVFQDQLGLLQPVPEVTGSVAFALHLLRVGESTADFPDMPEDWYRAAESSRGPLFMPDGLFDLIFPA